MRTLFLSAAILAATSLAAHAENRAGTNRSLTMPNAGLNEVRISTDVKEALDEAIQEEYRAMGLYQKVLNTLGDYRPFSNIIKAEERHAQMVSDLFRSYGFVPPESRWTEDDFPTFASLREACLAGVKSERKTIALYDRLLSLELPEDVQDVFEYLRSASQDNHLEAFLRCAGRESDRSSTMWP